MAIEACVIAFIANRILVKRFHPVLIYVIFILIQVIRSLLAEGSVWQRFILFVVSLFLLFTVCYHSNQKRKLSFLFIYITITVCCETIIGKSVSSAFGNSLTLYEPIAVYTAFAIHKLVLGLLAFFSLKIHKQGFYIEKWFGYLPIPIGILISFLGLINPFFENTEGTEQIIALGLLGLLTCVFMIRYVQYKEIQKRTAEKLRMTEEHEWYKRHFEEDKAAFIQRQDSIEHDLQDHLESVLTMNTVDEIRDYLAPILKLSNNSMKITGNKDIDSIIWPKQQRAEKKGISFNVTGLLPDKLDFLHKYDVVSIIGNGLNNAIDACERINSNGMFINVSFDFQRHLTIQIDNPYVEAPVVEESGRFKSIKKEPGHGLGMENMQEAVDRYHGHVEPVIENGIFSLRIFLQNMMLPNIADKRELQTAVKK